MPCLAATTGVCFGKFDVAAVSFNENMRFLN